MKLNDFTQFFDNPKVSVFNRSKSVELPVRIGKFYPVKWDLLSFGNSTKSSSGHKMRLAPMLAPNFTNLRFEEHAAVVPLRVIIEDYEETFNYSKNLDGASLPSWSASEYHRILLALCLSGHSLQGSLFDYFSMPIYSDLFQSIVNAQSNLTINYSGIGNFNIFDTSRPETTPENFLTAFTSGNYNLNGYIVYRSFNYYLNTVDGFRTPKFQPFFWWLVNKVVSELNTDSLSTLWSELSRQTLLDYVAFKLNTTSSSLTNEYMQYVFGKFLAVYINSLDLSTVETRYTSLPFRAYLRVYMDWLTNGNFVDRDLYLSVIHNFETNISLSASAVISNPDVPFNNVEFLYPANRLWNYDYFTSLLPTSKADNAVEIPANSSVLDLAGLTAFQKLVLRLSYSSRYRDVIWNVFKIMPSDARLQQSSIINERIHNVGIGEAIQTSETSVSSVLGSFAGRGYSSGNNKGYHIFCEEPCIVFDFVSMIPIASYRDSLHPLCHVDDILDIPIPGMDVLGNTPISTDLISGNVVDSDIVFGFGRQYQEWLYNFNTVHGEFRTSLDYWQLSRSFDSTPALNDEFLRIDDREDLDSIFSIVDAPHAFLSMYYNSKVTRHVSRSVRILI